VNLICQSWGERTISAGDTIIVSEWEHHSNFVPWQRLAARKNAELWVIPVSEHGELDLDAYERKLLSAPSVKLLAIGHVSNTLGSVAPIEKLVNMLHAKQKAAKVFVDGAQAAPHIPIHLNTMPVDFYAVSAHKMLGPMGIGGVFVEPKLLEQLEPALVGGGMIDVVSMEKTTYAESLEDRFTAGTPDVASLVGWAAACEYLNTLGMKNVAKHEHALIEYALSELAKLPQIHVVGPLSAADRTSVVTFLYTGVHAHDVAQILDSEGVAIRSGHHCTMPLHVKFGWAATIRMSFQVYSCKEDIDQAVFALKKVHKIFGV
jgi:cysteine desulfurase/selenocysteine lyase